MLDSSIHCGCKSRECSLLRVSQEEVTSGMDGAAYDENASPVFKDDGMQAQGRRLVFAGFDLHPRRSAKRQQL